MRTFDIANALGRFGVSRQLSRADLLQILREAAPDVPLDMAVRITRLVEYGEEVEAFDDTRSPGRFDLVVGADGIHSGGAPSRRGRGRDAADRLGRLGVVGAGRRRAAQDRHRILGCWSLRRPLSATGSA